ncbi:MAG: GNAT family N-acetyltransferase [Bacteroidia bacterium]|nr:GNAT family N-acetyltransferase [Bacteroidia bacterium]MBP9689384.1 GNAT family N-acetyltransferase [Bacteroidia bacterium]
MTQLKQHTIETERLLLKAFTPEVYFYAFNNLNNTEIKELFGHTSDEELAVDKDRYENGLTTFNKDVLFFQIRDKLTNRFMGWCGYHTWYFTHFRAEVFYNLNDENDRRKGVISEALLEVLKYGFNEMKLIRIEAFVALENEASIATLKKFGFKQEGVFRKHYHYQGENTDSIAYGLLKEEYCYAL